MITYAAFGSRWSKGLNFISPRKARGDEIHLSQDKTKFCLDSSRTLFGLSFIEAARKRLKFIYQIKQEVV